MISVTSSPLSSSSSPLSTPKDKRSDKRATSNLGLSVLPEGGGGGARTERSVGRDSKKKTLEGLLEMKKGDEWVGFWVVIKKNKMQYKNKETKFVFFFYGLNCDSILTFPSTDDKLLEKLTSPWSPANCYPKWRGARERQQANLWTGLSR